MSPSLMASWTRRAIIVGGLSSTIAPLGIGVTQGGLLHQTNDLSAHFAALEARITDEFKSRPMVGLTIAVAHNGITLWEKGYGFANRETGRRAEPRTPFSLASITKLFTAAATMALHERGSIVLDEPIEHHLGTSWPSALFDTRGVTPRLLGGHAAGLPSFFQLADVAGQPPSLSTLMDGFGRLAYPAGERLEYSNLGYGLLGEAIAHAAQQPYERFVHDELIDPMGLRNTFFAASPLARERMATRYDDSGKAYPLYTTTTPASGELVGSVHDLNRFAAHIMNSGGHSVLSKATLADMLSPVIATADDSFSAFGWAGRKLDGETVFAKSGGDPGVATRLIVMPKRGISIAVCANTGCDAFVGSISNDIAMLYCPRWASPSEAPLASSRADRHSGFPNELKADS